jgi:protein-S-isoprenylcysteine O-methyltransferase Ste14
VILPASGVRVAGLYAVEYQPLQMRFLLVGGLLVLGGLVLQIGGVAQRRTIGVADGKRGLVTSGLYGWFRHPIYVGTAWVCLGLAVLLRNPDGLLVWPAIVAVYLLQAISEERNDMTLKFPDEYRSYRRRVRMFGPIWSWTLCVGTVAVLAGCSTSPNLTAADRRADIEYLAQWARDYSPIAALAAERRGDPDFEELLAKYLEYAEHAESDEEFCRIVKGYYDVVCPAGHRYLAPESELRLAQIAVVLGIIDIDISRVIQAGPCIGRISIGPRLRGRARILLSRSCATTGGTLRAATGRLAALRCRSLRRSSGSTGGVVRRISNPWRSIRLGITGGSPTRCWPRICC